MPYDDPDPTDPSVLVGVPIPADEEVHRETAAAFSSEFAQLGYNETMIHYLFTNPFYAGAHRALQALGDQAIREIVREHATFWENVRIACRASTNSCKSATLVVRSMSQEDEEETP